MHTPTPWLIEDRVPGREVGYRAIVAGDNDDREGGEIICYPSPMGEANARLIAAAPDLLAALCDLVDYYGPAPDVDNGLDERLTAARAAVTRATTEA